MKASWHYLILIAVLAFGLVGLVVFKFDHSGQMAVAIGMGIFYVLWGVIHHHHLGDLHHKIIWEYALMALLAILVIGSILYRA